MWQRREQLRRAIASGGVHEIPTPSARHAVAARRDHLPGPRRVLTRIVFWWSSFTSLTGAVSRYSISLLVRFCFGAGEAGAALSPLLVVPIQVRYEAELREIDPAPGLQHHGMSWAMALRSRALWRIASA